MGIEDVLRIAFELGVGLFLDYHQQIAVDTSPGCAVTFAAKGELHPVLDSGGYPHANILTLAYESASGAALAGIADDLALAVTLRAGAVSDRTPEQGIRYVLNLSPAVAGRAGLDVGRIAGALTVAFGAGTVPLERDFFLASLQNLFEGKTDPGADVPTAHCACPL